MQVRTHTGYALEESDMNYLRLLGKGGQGDAHGAA
jgi:hypothetical protein